MTGNIGEWGELYTLFKLLANRLKYKQFGNAVTIPAVEIMTKFMKKCFIQIDDSNERGNQI